MKIYIRQIKPEGSLIEESFEAQWVGLAREDSVRIDDVVTVKAKITRVDDELFANVTVKSRYAASCSRCLGDVNRDWTVEFALTFDLEKQTEFIEMDDDVRQEIILNLPMRVLCREDCKGLCIVCGANLNEQNCGHIHSTVK